MDEVVVIAFIPEVNVPSVRPNRIPRHNPLRPKTATSTNTNPTEQTRMKPIATSLVLFFALTGAITAIAQTKPAPAAHAHHPQPATTTPQTDVPAAAQPAVAVVEQFGQALAAGDFKTVETLLDPDVLILETGGAERSRAEYMGHHAISDAQFLKGTHSQIQRRRARSDGDLVWVGTESELHAAKDGKPLTLLSTETMVLKKTGADWRIVHIHWSSRPKKTK
ncbi:MAG TPA: nuclear transport factor 2 family protein [Pseudoxanthomonas sp.]